MKNDVIDLLLALLAPVWLMFIVALLATFVRRHNTKGRSGWTLMLAVVPFSLIGVLSRAATRGDELANRFSNQFGSCALTG